MRSWLRKTTSSWRKRRFWGLALAAPLLLPLLLGLHALCLPLPPELVRAAEEAHLTLYDRDGQVLARIRRSDGLLHSPVSLDELSPFVVPALLAAEDQRFYYHPGVDPLAVGRALFQNLRAGHIVSGASTLTQQLARNVSVRPRTFAGKWRELALALRIEISLSKRQILNEYLNRVHFGPRILGIAAASREFFDKPAQSLDLAEAATLAALPKGATVYDPIRHPESVLARRNYVLSRMAEMGAATDEQIRIALASPLHLERGYIAPGGFHFVRAALKEQARGSTAAAAIPDPQQESLTSSSGSLQTTLDSHLQRAVEEILVTAKPQLAQHGASAAAALVLDNASGDVLAYVGSPDPADQRALGQNDGVLAKRQPGSTLKPFVYALAIENLGYTVASRVRDIPLRFKTRGGDYEPRNYDAIFHGPVTVRAALANSLNVPAVDTINRLGTSAVLDRLRDLGMTSLSESPDHYGLALALGDGEVTLWELVGGYRTLARGGLYSSAQLLKKESEAPEARVFKTETAALITDVLADNAARIASFGADSALQFPFPVAAKTGTSKGYRDNWTVGFSSSITVGVWVGNFDGKPMIQSSGVTGAGPLFHKIMSQAMQGRAAAELRLNRIETNDSAFSTREVCADSGLLTTPDCPHTITEVFARGTEPSEHCDRHLKAFVDDLNHMLTAPDCPGASSQVFETYPPSFQSWAEHAQRPLLPHEVSPRCPKAADYYRAHSALRPYLLDSAPRVLFPHPGTHFLLDPLLPSDQQRIAIEASTSRERIRFLLDGQELAEQGAPFRVMWKLSRGNHMLIAETPEGERSAPVQFTVE